MKLARYISAGIGTGACALVLTGGALISGAAPAGAATLAPAAVTARTAAAATAQPASGQNPAEAMAAWVNGPGYRYLNATEAAEQARDGAALARAATLAAKHPQPTDTAAYVAMMDVYAAAGRALAHGQTATANADLAQADDMAWDVIEATFSALNRIPG